MNSNHSSQSDADEGFVQQNQVLQVKEDPEVQIQKKILEIYEQDEKKGKINILSEDVQFKLQKVLEDISEDEGNNFQSIITLRMKELAYSKILVLTYEKSFFRLVQALFHIGKQYLKFNCHEQALTHLQNAITKNVKASSNLINKMYHSYLLTYYGQAYFQAKKYKEAEIQLEKALNLQREYESTQKKVIRNLRTLVVYAKVKAQSDIQQSNQLIEQAVRKAKEFVQQNYISQRTYGLTLLEQATILRKQGKKTQLIKLYEQAIGAIERSSQPSSQIDIINIYQELASLYKELGDSDKYLSTLKLRFQVFQDNYGNADKRTIKQQRAFATFLLNCKKIEEALDEFDDILQKCQKVFGQNSIEVGKQFKTIGNIYIIKGQMKAAENNFKKSLKIFHDLGEQRLAKQVRIKISSLQIQ